MKSEKIFESVINKWKAIVETNEGLPKNSLIKCEETELDDGISIKIWNCNQTHVFTYRGYQNKGAIREYAYDMLLEQCIFDLFTTKK